MQILLGIICSLSSTIVLALPKGDPTEVPDGEPTEVPTEVTTAKDNEENGVRDTCIEVMANNGLNYTSFWHGAAHGIHSIGLEEIRHFFDPTALEHNRIPVVNANLSAEETILFHAPLRGYDEDFKTMALKVMAFFMLHDKPDFYQQGVNTLEKLTHQYHMHEIYAAAAPIYRKMKENPPADADLCPCVNDVTANGILTEMVHIAKKLKYFARQPRNTETYSWCAGFFSYSNTYANTCGDGGGDGRPQLSGSKADVVQTSVQRTSERPTSFSRGKRNVANKTEMIAQYEQEYLADSSHENAHKVMNLNAWKANTLLGPAQWVSYEAMLTWSMLEEEELNDFAVFMYCKLNQPELDHTKGLFD